MRDEHNSGNTIAVREGDTVCQRTHDDIIQINDDDAANLHTGFDLARPRCSHNNALIGCNHAQRRNNQLTREDNADHPACHRLLLYEQDERRRYQQLIGQRINELAEIRHLIVLSCYIAVQKIRERCHAEQHERDDRAGRERGEIPGLIDDQHGLRRKIDEKRNHRNAGQRDFICGCHRKLCLLLTDTE